ncbi:MAG: hypothetical protein ABW188_17345, partial [Rhodococcus fascians]
LTLLFGPYDRKYGAELTIYRSGEECENRPPETVAFTEGTVASAPVMLMRGTRMATLAYGV